MNMSMFSKLKQFKDIRDQAKKIQGALANESGEGTAAFGKVKVVMDGNMQVTAVSIDPEMLTTDKKEKLESALKDAVNEATKKIQRVMASKMKDMGGLDFLNKQQ